MKVGLFILLISKSFFLFFLRRCQSGSKAKVDLSCFLLERFIGHRIDWHLFDRIIERVYDLPAACSFKSYLLNIQSSKSGGSLSESSSFKSAGQSSFHSRGDNSTGQACFKSSIRQVSFQSDRSVGQSSSSGLTSADRSSSFKSSLGDSCSFKSKTGIFKPSLSESQPSLSESQPGLSEKIAPGKQKVCVTKYSTFETGESSKATYEVSHSAKPPLKFDPLSNLNEAGKKKEQHKSRGERTL